MTMIIGTHHGKFHADEVVAIAILRQLDPGAKVIRSRDPLVLERCDIVVDVNRSKYDHHTTDKQYRDNGIPFASAGLVWRDFGEEVVRRFGADEHWQTILTNIDEKLIQAVDAIDNGVDLDRDSRMKSLSELIGSFNPPWNQDTDDDAPFEDAVLFASRILGNYIRSEVSRIDAAGIVKVAYESRKNPALLILSQFCPWSDTLLELDTLEEVKFVVFPEKTGQYRLQVVPKVLGSFEPRRRLPENWAGKEGDELIEVTGQTDAVFCHPARFIAGAKSFDAILKMAELALRE